MNNYKIILPYVKMSMKVIGILIIIFLIYLVMISMVNPDNIDIKNSNRRKITEKIEENNIKKNNMYLKKKNDSLKTFGITINDNVKNFFNNRKK